MALNPFAPPLIALAPPLHAKALALPPFAPAIQPPPGPKVPAVFEPIGPALQPVSLALPQVSAPLLALSQTLQPNARSGGRPPLRDEGRGRHHQRGGDKGECSCGRHRDLPVRVRSTLP